MIPSLVHLHGHVPGDFAGQLEMRNVSQDLIVEILSTIHEPKTLQAAGQVLSDYVHRELGQKYLERARSLMEAAHALRLGDQAERGQLGDVHTLKAEYLTDAKFESFLLLLGGQCLSGLTDLNLSRSNVTGPIMASLSKEILAGRLAKCQYLQLRHNGINDVDMRVLSGAVREMPELRELWLQGNSIGDEGMEALVDAVRIGEESSEEAVGEAAQGLRIAQRWALPRLESLLLNVNPIGDAGWTALAEAIASGSLPSLRELVANYKPSTLLHACEARGIWLR